MKTTGEEIFWQNARSVLWDMGMLRLDPAHGAAVEVIRWCLTVRGRPTHYRQDFLERESPPLLAYLEWLAKLGEWRTLEERIQLRAEILRENDLQPCARPWLAAIWHTLPELAALGQYLLDRQAKKEGPSPGADPTAADTTDSKGGGDKAGSAGTKAKPQPSPRLSFPVVPAVLTSAEKKALERADAKVDDAKKELDGPEGDGGAGGPGGMKGPGGRK
jgi:hypothetical protein